MRRFLLIEEKVTFFKIGTPAFTSRGATEEDFIKIAHFFHRAISFASTLDAKVCY